MFNAIQQATPMQGSQRRISGQIAVILLVVIGGLLMLATLQRQLIYFPEVAPESILIHTANGLGLVDWRDAGGELIGWRTAPSDDSARRIVVFHGNAGYALHRQYYATGFLAQGPEWQVYLFEYPGYGARPGKPSESDIKTGATNALKALLAKDPAPIYLVGESLGSGVATHLAGVFREQIAGLLLVTPFTSLADVASTHYGKLPVRALLSERYDSVEALSTYEGPTALLIAGADEIVPATLGRKLHAGYSGPKWLHEQPGAGHNTLNFAHSAHWWREVTQFWQSN